MLSAKILNSDATLNKFETLGSLEFIAGEQFELNLQLFQPQRKDKLRYVAPGTAELTIHLPIKGGSTLDVVMTPFDGDWSMWGAEISEAQSEQLVSGNFTFTLDVEGDGSELIKGWVENALSLVITGAC